MEDMIEFCNKENIKIYADNKPCTCARITMPYMSKEEIKDIKKKPFLNKRNINFFIHYQDEVYTLFIQKGYPWDGASIPFGFRWMLGGKGNPQFLIASCVHDKMCENKQLIDYDRPLSSLIFKELLLACGCSKLKANIMYQAVNNFQKLVRGWKK